MSPLPASSRTVAASSRAFVAVLGALVVGALAPLWTSAPDAPEASLYEGAPPPVLRAPPAPVVLDGPPGLQRLQRIAPWAEPPHGAGPWSVLQRAAMRPPITPASHRVAGSLQAGGWVRIDFAPRDADQLDAAPALASVDLSSAIERAIVSVVREDGTERVCDRFIFGRWVCGPDEWNHVAVTDVVVRDRAGSCIWAHPTNEGELRIAFPDLPRATSLHGRHALADAGAASPDGAPVSFSIDVDGATINERTQVNRRGWTSWRAAVPSSAATTMDVTFRVRADNVGARHFCFTAELSMRPERATPSAREARHPVRAADLPAVESSGVEGSGAEAGGPAGAESPVGPRLQLAPGREVRP